MSTNRLMLFLAGSLLVLLAWGSSVSAHHGWSWAEEEQTEMSGTITDIYIGPPHPRLMVETENGSWRVDLGNPRRTRDAGFVDGEAAVGDEVQLLGNRSRDSDEAVFKAVRATINGQHYTFYPERL